MVDKLLKDRVCILDGGLSTELERIGFSLENDPLWSARFLYTNPEAIVAAHENYFNSGADIITTASYQASLAGFEKHLKLSNSEGKDLIKKSVELAKKAQINHSDVMNKERKTFIAGSVGPFGACEADGSEYTGDYCERMNFEELMLWHHPRIECLLDAGVDVLAFETIPAIKEAEALLMLLSRYPHAKAWLSFSCQTPHETCHREQISNDVHRCLKVAPSNQLLAMGVNCCPPQNVESLLKNMLSVCPELSLLAYPNSGEVWDNKTGWSGILPEKTLDNYMISWMPLPIKIIGGCCRTTSIDIQKIAMMLNETVRKKRQFKNACI